MAFFSVQNIAAKKMKYLIAFLPFIPSYLNYGVMAFFEIDKF